MVAHMNRKSFLHRLFAALVSAFVMFKPYEEPKRPIRFTCHMEMGVAVLNEKAVAKIQI